MLAGPVVVTSEVTVLLMKELKIAAGLIAAERMRLARLKGAAAAQRRLKIALLSLVRGFGLGIVAIRMVRRARNVTMLPVTRVSSVGLRSRSVGQRERCQSAERCVRLYRAIVSASRPTTVAAVASSSTARASRA